MSDTDNKQFVVVLSVDSLFLEDDDSIERACEMVNEYLWDGDGVNSLVADVRPLSEVIAC